MISDELKTIFIHSPRTGGTSIEYALVGKDYWQIDPERKHISCTKAEEIYKEKWKDYFTFSVVRNPYCRAVSLWKYRQKRSGKNGSFTLFLARHFGRHSKQRYPLQSDFLNAEVDFIGRFENLKTDFQTICDKLSTDAPELPHKNNLETEHYATYYTKFSKIIADHALRQDIERFNYHFEDTEDKQVSYNPLEKRLYLLIFHILNFSYSLLP